MTESTIKFTVPNNQKDNMRRTWCVRRPERERLQSDQSNRWLSVD